jgi:hypothetical protein
MNAIEPVEIAALAAEASAINDAAETRSDFMEVWKNRLS